MILNIVFVCKSAGMSFDWVSWVFKPAAASALMGIAVWILKLILPFGRISTILEILLGISVFAVSAWLLKAVKPEDLSVLRRRKRRA